MGGPTGPANGRLYQKVVQSLDSKLQLHGNSVSVQFCDFIILSFWDRPLLFVETVQFNFTHPNLKPDFRWSRRSQGHRSDGFRFELVSQEPNHRLKARNTVSYAKIDDFGLFRCEHKRGPSGQVKFAITKRRTNDSFKSLSPLRGLTQKKKKYSDCKIFGKRVSLINLKPNASQNDIKLSIWIHQ